MIIINNLSCKIFFYIYIKKTTLQMIVITIIIKSLSDEPFWDHMKGRHCSHCFQCLLMPA